MFESVPPPLRRVEDGGVIVLKVATVVGLAAAGALASTLPAAVRVSAVLAGELPGVRAWASLTATALVPMALSVVVLTGARQGVRTFGDSGLGLRAFGIALWLGTLLVAFSVFGGVLRATTHHRALAAVTYACGALAMTVVCGVACARVVAVLRGASPGVQRLGMALLGGCTLVAIAFLGVRFGRVVSEDESSAVAGATVVDVLAFTVSAVAASFGWGHARRPFAIVGPPVAVFVAALGVTTLRDPPVRQAIGDRAPAFVPAADVLVGR